MHLAITTREDPQLPLARLRARDQVTELRASDLRFTPAEAAAFLNQVIDLDALAEDIADAINGAITLAALRIAQGRLREAMRTYERALQLANSHDAHVPRGTADIYVGMSEVAYEQNNLPAATRHLLRSQGLGEHTGFPQNRYRWRVAMARIREAEGDLDGALDLLGGRAPLHERLFAKCAPDRGAENTGVARAGPVG